MIEVVHIAEDTPVVPLRIDEARLTRRGRYYLHISRIQSVTSQGKSPLLK